MSAPTAAQRGPEWTARYGCTPWCVMDHAGEDGEPGWHKGPTAAAASPVPFADALLGAAPCPIVTATVVQTNELADVFGIETQLWVDVGTETLELTAEQGRQLLAQLREFLPLLEARCSDLEHASADDRPADPAARAAYLASQRRATPIVLTGTSQ